MKIAVYTIAKNEEKMALRWSHNTQDADLRLVLDTGSSDQTVELLKSQGVSVLREEIIPWRFDVARNKALAALPIDVDVAITLDMDQLLSPGWRQKLEDKWEIGKTSFLQTPIVEAWDTTGMIPTQMHSIVAIHSPHKFYWMYAIHETLVAYTPQMMASFSENNWCPEILIEHRQDPTKSRHFYIDMLKYWVQQEPNESRYFFYLARETFSMAYFDEAIPIFEKYVQMSPPSPERSYGLRMLAQCYLWTQRSFDLIMRTYLQAVADSPQEREVWGDMASFLVKIKNWPNAFSSCINALRIQDQKTSYFIEPKYWRGQIEEWLLLSAEQLRIPLEVLTHYLPQAQENAKSFPQKPESQVTYA